MNRRQRTVVLFAVYVEAPIMAPYMSSGITIQILEAFLVHKPFGHPHFLFCSMAIFTGIRHQIALFATDSLICVTILHLVCGDCNTKLFSKFKNFSIVAIIVHVDNMILMLVSAVKCLLISHMS